MAERPAIAISLLVVANGLTASVDSLAKYLSADLHSVQIVWGYFFMISATLLCYAMAKGLSLRAVLHTSRPVLHLTRAGLLALTITSLFVAIAYIPFAEAIALAFMAPLFITLLAVPLLGERFRLYRLVAVGIGLIGVLVIVRPGAVEIHWAVFMALASAVFFALFQMLTRLLARTEATSTTMFYTSIGTLAWMSLVVGFFWQPFSFEHGLVLAGAGLLGAMAHFCMIRAFELAEASALAPFNYAKLVWASAIGYFAFGETVSGFTLTGSAIIVSCGCYVWFREHG